MSVTKEKSCSHVLDAIAVSTFLFLPERQVLLEELDDGLGVTEVVLVEVIDLVKCLLQGLVSQLTSLFVILHHLVLEHGEVQGQAKLDWVARNQIDVVGIIVGLEGLLLDFFELGVLAVLADVAVVVTDHLDEKGLGLTVALLGEDVVVDDLDDALAVLDELSFDLGLVGREGIRKLGVLGVLLDR